jgi:phosphoglycolate phosphatase
MTKAASPIQHVIWDWNGTLLDDTWLCIDIMNGLLRERALPLLTHQRYQEIFDFPVVEYYRRLGFDFTHDPFEIIGAEFIRRYEMRRYEARLHPHGLITLAHLHERGFTQAVLSAYRHDTLEELLAHFGVRHYLREVLGSDNVYAAGKLEQGVRWIKQLGLDPAGVVMVGDTVHDYEVSRAMNCACILIADGYHPREKLVRCGVPVLDTLDALVGALDQGP